MYAEIRSAARGAQQFLSLLRRPNTYICQRKMGTFSSDNVQKSPGVSSKSPRGFCGNGVFSRSLVPLHLQTVFMSFSAIPQGFRDDDFSELDAKEMKEDERFKDALTKKVPSLTSLFSNQNVTRSVKSVISIPSGKNAKKNVKSVTSIPAEKKEKKNVISVTSIPSEKNEKKSVNSVTSISSEKTQKKNMKSEQQQKTTPKTEEAKGGLDILQHPWPEWVQFLEHLNERGYLSKVFHFQWPIELRGLSTEGIYAFIKFAAFSFAEDHVEISKWPASIQSLHMKAVLLQFNC